MEVIELVISFKSQKIVKKIFKFCKIDKKKIGQNRFINEYARKKKAKISKSRSYLVRYRRTYVLKKKQS